MIGFHTSLSRSIDSAIFRCRYLSSSISSLYLRASRWLSRYYENLSILLTICKITKNLLLGIASCAPSVSTSLLAFFLLSWHEQQLMYLLVGHYLDLHHQLRSPQPLHPPLARPFRHLGTIELLQRRPLWGRAEVNNAGFATVYLRGYTTFTNSITLLWGSML